MCQNTDYHWRDADKPSMFVKLCYSIFINTYLYLPGYSRKYSTHRVRQITTKRWRMTEIVNHLSSILDKSSTKENICDENLAYIYDKVEDFTNQILQKIRRGNAFRWFICGIIIFFFVKIIHIKRKHINTLGKPLYGHSKSYCFHISISKINNNAGKWDK